MHRLKFLWLVVLTLVLFVADLVLGSVSIPLKELPSAQIGRAHV